MAIGLGIGMLVAGLVFIESFEGWERRLADTLFVPRPVSGDVVLVAIDDKSIQAIGRWPWDRGVHAKVLDKLGEAKVVGFDVSFPETSVAAQDDLLIKAVKKQGRVVMPLTYAKWASREGNVIIQEVLQPFTGLAEVTGGLGVVNKLPDPDGIIRLTPIRTIDESGNKMHNFSVQVIALFLDKTPEEIEQNIVVEQGFMRINFASRPKSFKTVSYIDVLNDEMGPEVFANKIVLIGSTALDLHDNQVTPISGGVAMDGVEIHANTIQTILEGSYLANQAIAIQMVIVMILSLVVALGVSYLRIIWATILTAVLGIGYLLYAIWWSFDRGVIPVMSYVGVAMLVTYIVGIVYKYLTENRQKQFIKKAFSYYLSEEVMREVLKDPKKLALGGERRLITVLFSDIAGFTSISEQVTPEQLALLLNKYLTRMTKTVFTYNGVLDKYIGDAVMAFWGAPKVLTASDQAFLACQTALEMQKQILEVKKDWSEVGDIDFEVRIGVNTGEMAVGNMGSDQRFDYTLLGDNVNLGSRLEGINKEYGTKIIVAESTAQHVKDRMILRKVDTVAVKGKALGIVIYELRGLGKPEQDEADFIDMFEEARIKYERGEFRQALGRFTDVAKLWSNDPVTEVYIERCKELIKHPPEKWDGVFHSKSK